MCDYNIDLHIYGGTQCVIMRSALQAASEEISSKEQFVSNLLLFPIDGDFNTNYKYFRFFSVHSVPQLPKQRQTHGHERGKIPGERELWLHFEAC